MRPFLIAGNWKMNCGPARTEKLLNALKNKVEEVATGVEVLVCPPTVSLPAGAAVLKHHPVEVGAQNVHFEDEGAYTGEISTDMLNEVGCAYVILGHSERREYFGETDATVNKKVHKALSAGLRPIVCVGESLAQRKKEVHRQMVKRQVQAALNGVDEQDAVTVVIAYEPLWAIGTGETATPDQAQEMHAEIRAMLAELFSTSVAEGIQILYGGSMKPHNAEQLLARPDVDGGLIGGASLKAQSFTEIIEIAEQLATD